MQALGLFLFLAFYPSMAFANGAIPFTALIYPLFWLLFIPIVLVEAFIYLRMLGGRWKSLLWITTKANLISTALGFFAGLVIIIPDIAILVVAMQDILRDGRATALALFNVGLILLLFFFFTVWVEHRYLKKKMPDIEPKKLKKAIWVSHIASYGLITLIVLSVSIWLHT